MSIAPELHRVELVGFTSLPIANQTIASALMIGEILAVTHDCKHERYKHSCVWGTTPVCYLNPEVSAYLEPWISRGVVYTATILGKSMGGNVYAHVAPLILPMPQQSK